MSNDVNNRVHNQGLTLTCVMAKSVSAQYLFLSTETRIWCSVVGWLVVHLKVKEYNRLLVF